MKSAIVGSIYMLLIMLPLSVSSSGSAPPFTWRNMRGKIASPADPTEHQHAGRCSFHRIRHLGPDAVRPPDCAGAELDRRRANDDAACAADHHRLFARSDQAPCRKARRDASFALGANKWQTVSRAVLPSALPGILTGVILAMSRAIGETAPLIMIGALTYVAFLPKQG